MSTKLTLSMDERVISSAKQYARRRRTSLSKMIEQYLRSVTKNEKAEKAQEEYGPITQSLLGVLKDVDFNKEDYTSYLEKKYK